MIKKRKSFLRSCIIFWLFFFSFFLPLSVQADSHNNKYGGRLVLSTTSDPKSFNDIIAKETSTTLVTGYIFEGLTTTNAFTAKVEPQLAESWNVSENGLEWTFHLRTDVQWNDGEPFTADDVVFTFNDLIYNPDVPNSASDIYRVDGKPFKVLKVDTYRVKFILPSKFAPFLRSMGQGILPKHVLKEAVEENRFNFTWGIDSRPEEIVGTGPYKLIKYEQGQRLVFGKNPLYWKKSAEGEQLPYIEEIVYLIVQNVDVQLAKFVEGSIDYYGFREMDYPYLKPLEEKKNFTVYDLGPDRGSQFVVFNQNMGENEETGEYFVAPFKLKWFRDLNFRKAVAHAIDKEMIIEIVKNGLGYPQYSPIGPGSGFFHNPDVKKYDYDPDKAKEYLRKCGFKDRNEDGILEDKDGHDIEFNLYTSGSERIETAAIIRHDLVQLGMKVNFQVLEFNTLVRKLDSTFEWDAIVIGLTGGIEPHDGQNVWNSGGHLHMWYPRQENPSTKWEEKIDKLYSEGVQELDEDKRKKIYDEFQVIVSKQLPLNYTVLGSRISAVRNKLGNLKPANYGGVLHNIEEIFIQEGYR